MSKSYDAANRLSSVEGVSYTWDDNGNLLSDGVSTYTYNHSNQLTGVSQGGTNYSYAYNGLGDRLRQTVGGNTVNYAIDSSSGLSHVLADGTNTYLYGLDRISQSYTGGKDYFLGDALGSVRQMANTSGGIVLSRNYEPYGTIYGALGNSNTAYGFTSEWTDGTGLVNLRARYYAPTQGRFVSQDRWGGSQSQPITLNKWLYANSNPVVYSDPSGNWTLSDKFELVNGGFYNFGMLEFSEPLPCTASKSCLSPTHKKAHIYIHGLGGNDIRYAEYQVVSADFSTNILHSNLSDLILKFYRIRTILDCPSGDFIELPQYFNSGDWNFITQFSGDSYNFIKENGNCSAHVKSH